MGLEEPPSERAHELELAFAGGRARAPSPPRPRAGPPQSSPSHPGSDRRRTSGGWPPWRRRTGSSCCGGPAALHSARRSFAFERVPGRNVDDAVAARRKAMGETENQNQVILERLYDRVWTGEAHDFAVMDEVFAEDAVVEYPQSGERM